MPVNDEFEYRFKVEFPLAKIYAVNDILKLISEVIYSEAFDNLNHSNRIKKRVPFGSVPYIPPHKLNNHIDECHHVLGERLSNELSASQVISTEQKNSGNLNENFELSVHIQPSQELDKKKFMDDYKLYLIDRLLKAVSEGKFELWDSTGGKVVDPPVNNASSSTMVIKEARKPLPFDTFLANLNQTDSPPRNSFLEPNFMPAFAEPVIIPNSFRSNHRRVYSTAFIWATMTTILKPDLIKFCRDQRIHAIFEDQQTTSQVTDTGQENSQSQSNGIACCQPMTSQPAQEPVATVNANSKAYDEQEGITEGMIFITQLVIKIARKIEFESGQRASVGEVMGRLKDLVGNKDFPELRKISTHGVMWLTTTCVERNFDKDSCRRVLKKYLKNAH